MMRKWSLWISLKLITAVWVSLFAHIFGVARGYYDTPEYLAKLSNRVEDNAC